MAKSLHANELKLIRSYDAPLKLVWEAYTEEEHLKKWWGPRGFSITTHSKDLSPGGQWKYMMHGPDGVDYPNITTYLEIEKYKKLIYDHGGNDDRQALFRMHVNFTEVQNKTSVEWTMTFATSEMAKEIGQFIKQVGGDSTWDRLGEYLEQIQNGNIIFLINRSFETDTKTLFDMWTNPELLKQWLPPTAASMTFFKADIISGGSSHYEMINADGSVMYGKINYKTIRPFDLLEYSQSFCDRDGKIGKPPFAPTWPDYMHTKVVFTPEGNNETRVTIKWQIDPSIPDIEKETFISARAGMTIGWTGSLDKLEQQLLR